MQGQLHQLEGFVDTYPQCTGLFIVAHTRLRLASFAPNTWSEADAGVAREDAYTSSRLPAVVHSAPGGRVPWPFGHGRPPAKPCGLRPQLRGQPRKGLLRIWSFLTSSFFGQLREPNFPCSLDRKSDGSVIIQSVPRPTGIASLSLAMTVRRERTRYY